MRVSDLLERTCSVGGSDLHLAAGLVPRIRLHGGARRGRPAGPSSATPTCAPGCARWSAAEQWAAFEQRGDLDYAYALSEDRFRANYFEQAAGHRGRLPAHPGAHRDAGGPLAAACHRAARSRHQRPRARHRADRVGQVDHAREHRPPHQRDLRQARRHHRGSHRVRPSRAALRLLAARGGHTTPPASPRRCAPPCGRTPT